MGDNNKKRLVVKRDMKVISVFVVCFCMIGDIMAQRQQTFFDTIAMAVEGTTINLARTHQDEYMIVYETWEKFVEHDTLFIYRALEYSYREESNEYMCDTASYFVLSHKQKNHLHNVERVSCQYYWPKTDDGGKLEYHSIAYNELKESVPILKTHQLGNMPRRWYPLMKYDNAFYFSVDENYVLEFNDSLLIFYGLEVFYTALTDFRKLDNGGWAYSYTLPNMKCIKGTIVPCKHLKGAYINTTETEPGEPPQQSLYASDESIGNFDIIGWKSTDHMETGLDRYEKIDFDAIR